MDQILACGYADARAKTFAVIRLLAVKSPAGIEHKVSAIVLDHVGRDAAHQPVKVTFVLARRNGCAQVFPVEQIVTNHVFGAFLRTFMSPHRPDLA